MAGDSLLATSEAGNDEVAAVGQSIPAVENVEGQPVSTADESTGSEDAARPLQSSNAEKEAKEALLIAVEKMKALKTATTVNVWAEYSQLEDIMDEFPSPPASPRPTSQVPPPFPHGGGTAPRVYPINLNTPSSQPIIPSCTIERLSMGDWRGDSLGPPRPGLPPPPPRPGFAPGPPRPGFAPGPPRPGPPPGPPGYGPSGRVGRNNATPVIQVYYRNVRSVPTTVDREYSDEDFKNAYTNAQNIEKPQRVKINSSILLDDLERIAGLTLPGLPHIIIPSFKLLVHNWDGIKSTLKKLTLELEDLEKRVTRVIAVESPTNARTGNEPQGTTTPTDDRAQEQTKRDIPVEDASNHKEVGQEEINGSLSSPERPTPSRSSTQANVDISLVRERNDLQVRVSHLRCLHDFILTDLSHLIGLRMKIQDGSLDKISFDEMYYLYSPGDLIIDRESDVDALYQVYAVTGGRMRLLKYVNNNVYRPPGEEEEADNSPEAGIGTWTDVVIDCFRLGWDGKKIGPRRITHRVPHYTGEKKITDLNYYPVRFRRNSEDIIKKLKLRGRAALECYGHKKYAARTTKHPSVREPLPLRKRMRSPPPRMSSGRAENAQLMGTAEKELESDVYVDIETFNEAFPFYETDFDHLGRVRPSLREVTESTPGGRDREYHIGDHDVDEARSDGFLSSHFHLTHAKRPEELADMEDYLMLLPHCVPAFDFRQREWYWLDVEKLEEIDKSEDARRRGWEDLVIEDGYSQLLLSLVDNHTSAFEHKKAKNSTTQSSQIDLIKGKGRGLILLLHGPPGTGKTSTAETIAAYTGKPLYAVTCGDIGVTAREVEDNLREHTERAEKWGCVLLLDEADVFLAKRTWTDMNRNAVVSVFLRHLEYYSGILFLTTNIVGIIDEAFKSRIHVALRYDMIDQSSTERIWNNILDRIIKDNETSDVKIKFDRDLLLEFALSHYEKHEEEETTWNARQIRNAFSTAIAMGQFDRFERIRKEGLSPDQAAASGTKSLMTIRLTKRNFAKIAETATDFERYINAVRGPDADNALASQQRDDYFARQLAPPRRKNRRGSADFGQGPRRRGYLTPQSSKPVKGKKVAERSVSPDDDQENSEQKTTRANKPRIRREEFSEDDEDGISDE